MIKTLNLFCGIGGNRLGFDEKYQVTAIDFNEKACRIYKFRFPTDRVIKADAYEYVRKHFSEFEFIWGSPSCKTHSLLNNINVGCVYNRSARKNIQLPDFRLYSLITFLKFMFRGIWVIENVRPYYPPLIPPSFALGRHYFWSNIIIPEKNFKIHDIGSIEKADSDYIAWLAEQKEVPIELVEKLTFLTNNEKVTIFRDMVNPKVARYIIKKIEQQQQQNLEHYFKKTEGRSCKNHTRKRYKLETNKK